MRLTTPKGKRWADFIKKNWKTMSDKEIAAGTDIKPSTVCHYRHLLGLGRKRGCPKGFHRKVNSTDMGTEQEIREALTNGGLTIRDIIRKNGLPISGERGRQIIETYCLTGRADQRTVLWYANRIGHPELARKRTFRKLSKAAGGIEALSRDLGVVSQLLNRIAHKHGIFRQKAERVTLVCSYPGCGKMFERNKLCLDRHKKRNPNMMSCCSRGHHVKLTWLRRKQEFETSRSL